MIPSIIIAVIVILIVAFIAGRYRKVGPNQALIITGGMLKGPYLTTVPETSTRVKVVKGGGAFVWPIVQRAQVLNMDAFTLEVNVKDVMTKDNVKVNANATATLRIGSDKKMIAIASEKIMGLKQDDLLDQMKRITTGAIRDTLSQLTPKEANDRAKFAEMVNEACAKTFANLGLEITNLSITDIWDDNHYYDSLAAADVAEKQTEAAKARADAERAQRIAKSESVRDARKEEAKNDQEAEIAEIESKNVIAAKQKDLDINKAQYLAQVNAENAKADKATDIESAKQDAILKKQQIEVNANEYQATIVTKQNADNEAKKSSADADFYQAQKQADAEAYKIRQNGEAQSEQIAKVGKAKADAQKALAEALNAKGAASSLASKALDMLPEIAKSNAEAISHVDHLTVLNGAEGLQNATASNLTSAIMMIKNTTGIDLTDVVEKRANGQLTLDDGDDTVKKMAGVVKNADDKKADVKKPEKETVKKLITKKTVNTVKKQDKIQVPTKKTQKTTPDKGDKHDYLDW